MNWPLSLLVALICAILGGVGTGLVAHVFVDWFRITSREGAAGYYVVGLGLLGIIGGFIVGLVCARVVASGGSPTFLKGLGAGVGATAGLLVIALGLGWLNAEFPPRIDGRVLMLDVEVSFPDTIELPAPGAGDAYRWSVTLTSFSGSRQQRSGDLRLRELSRRDGRNVVPASVYVPTIDRRRSLGVHCADQGAQYLDLPLAAKPTRADMEWSAWHTPTRDFHNQPIPAEKAVQVRYRIGFAETD